MVSSSSDVEKMPYAEPCYFGGGGAGALSDNNFWSLGRRLRTDFIMISILEM